MAEKFEISRLSIPLVISVTNDREWSYIIPVNSAATEAEWKKAEQLANDGWELVNAISLEGQRGGGPLGSNYTVGYILFFKRRIE